MLCAMRPRPELGCAVGHPSARLGPELGRARGIPEWASRRAASRRAVPPVARTGLAMTRVRVRGPHSRPCRFHGFGGPICPLCGQETIRVSRSATYFEIRRTGFPAPRALRQIGCVDVRANSLVCDDVAERDVGRGFASAAQKSCHSQSDAHGACRPPLRRKL